MNVDLPVPLQQRTPSSSAFLAIAAFYLYAEHRAHLWGILPYLPLLLCPLMHVFMHRGHGRHDR